MSQPGGDRRVTIDRRRADGRPFSGAQGDLKDGQPSRTGRTQPLEHLWDAREVARHLKVSVSWVRQRVSAHRIPFVRIGGWMVRFQPDDIRAFSASPSRGRVLPVKGPDYG